MQLAPKGKNFSLSEDQPKKTR
ncbi:hypothetical protein KIPB_008969, partial [Kipferlia bialata]|eukprot:g8969.t1